MPPAAGVGAGPKKVARENMRRVIVPTLATVLFLGASNRDARDSRCAAAGAALFTLYPPLGRTARPWAMCDL